MAKRRVGRYSNESRRACVERIKQFDDVSALSRELDIDPTVVVPQARSNRSTGSERVATTTELM